MKDGNIDGYLNHFAEANDLRGLDKSNSAGSSGLPRASRGRIVFGTSHLSRLALVSCFCTLVFALSGISLTGAEAKQTRIEIDGYDKDWVDYPVLVRDPQGDNRGGDFDISEVRGFANDQYLYLLVKTYGPRGTYGGLTVHVEANGRRFNYSFAPESYSEANQSETPPGAGPNMGRVKFSESAAADSVEFKIPLSSLASTENLILRAINPLAGTCCADQWYAIDTISSVAIPRLDETEPPVPPPPGICQAETPISGTAEKVFPAVTLPYLAPGLASTQFVGTSGLHLPYQVLLAPDGGLLVWAAHSHALFRVSEHGQLTRIGEANGYEATMGKDGRVYILSPPSGEIYRLSLSGETNLVVRSGQLLTAGGSGFAAGNDGNLYVALSQGSGPSSKLYRITPAGAIIDLGAIPYSRVLRASGADRLIAGNWNVVRQIQIRDNRADATTFATIPSSLGISPGGLALDGSGNLYVATGAGSPSGELFLVDSTGKAPRRVARIPGNGLSGLQFSNKTGEVYGAQLRTNALLAVGADGTVRTVVAGNNLVTPVQMAFSPCGDLAVVMDDIGMMGLVWPDGTVKSFFDYTSFTPPMSFPVFLPDGTLYASEAAPGFLQPRLVRVPKGGFLEPVIDARSPSGLALLRDGSLLVAETAGGSVSRLREGPRLEKYADRLTFPNALAVDANENLYVVTGNGGEPLNDVFSIPAFGDTIVRIAPSGTQSVFLQRPSIRSLAIAPSGDLYTATDRGVERVGPDGSASLVAKMDTWVWGLAFDLAGSLYLSDYNVGRLIRITGFPKGVVQGVVQGADGPISGAEVRVESRWPTVVGGTIKTDAQGNFRISVAPRSYTVTVSAEGFQPKVISDLTVASGSELKVTAGLLPPPPSIATNGIVNAASYRNAAEGVAPGSLISIFGQNLGPSKITAVSAYPLPTSVAGTSVSIRQGASSEPAYLRAASATQVNALASSKLKPGSAALTVTSNGQVSEPAMINILESAFGPFISRRDGDQPVGVVQNWVSAAEAPLNDLSYPARPGQIAILWGTGLGPITSPDMLPPAGGDLGLSPVVRVGSTPAKILYAGRAPGFAGVDVVYFEVPKDVSVGCYIPVVVTTKGVTSTSVTMAVTSDGQPCR